MKVVEYVDEDPARALPVENFDEGMAVPAKPVERECPLTREHAGGVREPQVGRHELGAVTVDLPDSAISRGEVRADWALVTGVRGEVCSQRARLVPVEW